MSYSKYTVDLTGPTVEDLKRQLKNEKNTNKTLGNQLLEANRKIQELERQIGGVSLQKYDDEIRNLRLTVQTQTQQLEQCKTMETMYRTKIEEFMKRDNSELQKKYDELLNSWSQVVRELDRIEILNKKLVKNEEKAKADLDTALYELQEKETEISRLKREKPKEDVTPALKDTLYRLDRFERKNTILERENVALEKVLDKFQKEKDELRAELTQERKDCERKLQQLRDACEKRLKKAFESRKKLQSEESVSSEEEEEEDSDSDSGLFEEEKSKEFDDLIVVDDNDDDDFPKEVIDDRPVVVVDNQDILPLLPETLLDQDRIELNQSRNQIIEENIAINLEIQQLKDEKKALEREFVEENLTKLQKLELQLQVIEKEMDVFATMHYIEDVIAKYHNKVQGALSRYFAAKKDEQKLFDQSYLDKYYYPARGKASDSRTAYNQAEFEKERLEKKIKKLKPKEVSKKRKDIDFCIQCGKKGPGLHREINNRSNIFCGLSCQEHFYNKC